MQRCAIHDPSAVLNPSIDMLTVSGTAKTTKSCPFRRDDNRLEIIPQGNVNKLTLSRSRWPLKTFSTSRSYLSDAYPRMESCLVTLFTEKTSSDASYMGNISSKITASVFSCTVQFRGSRSIPEIVTKAAITIAAIITSPSGTATPYRHLLYSLRIALFPVLTKQECHYKNRVNSAAS